jgi:hypothetical protein
VVDSLLSLMKSKMVWTKLSKDNKSMLFIAQDISHNNHLHS